MCFGLAQTEAKFALEKNSRFMIISHVRIPDGAVQSNEEHSEGVSKLCEKFASEFGFGEWGRVIGLLHDKGKEKKAFQQHILKDSGLDSTVTVEGDYKHAYVGALLAHKIYGQSYDGCFANPISAHHRGLYDNDELQVLLREMTIPSEVDETFANSNLGKPIINYKIEHQDFHHLFRMLFSCLVDADRLDTEQFIDPVSANMRKGKASLSELLPKLEKYLLKLKESASDSEVNHIRNQVQLQCKNASTWPQGFYSLTVPTGGGKTLSSLLWAMRHAICHGLNRIIIAIPYTSIIVQTASILKSIFGEENVLEHHSNIDFDAIGNEDEIKRIQLAMENWDYPIIVTTNVQLFESIYSNKTSACRKLHNIVKSVLILDEVQTLPTQYLQPIVDALKSYNKMFGVSVLFTTASQPVLSGLIEGCNPLSNFMGIREIKEIIPASFNLHDKLRRAKLEVDNSPKDYDEIATELCRFKRVLCIVNTRRDAKEIFRRLPDDGITLHLSRMMCPIHVSETLDKIKKALKDNSCEIIRIVSTQLVEAGVDIDFPVVFRQEAGLDSVLQAAGRCNREGGLKMGTTYVFSLTKVHNLPIGDMTDANNARKALKGDRDWFAPETMTAYFKQLYGRKSSFDIKGMKNYLYDPKNIMFETASNEFQLIEDGCIPLIVDWEKSHELVGQLRNEGASYSLMKQLSKYMVNVYKSDFMALKEIGVIEEVCESIFVVNQKNQYDKKLGLLIENQWEDKLLLI